MRHLFYILLTTLGLALSLSLMAFGLDLTGLWSLLGVTPERVVALGLAAGWIGGLSCWFLARSIAVWSLAVKPFDGEIPALARVATRLGVKAPDVATYESAESNAFAVGWLPSRSLLVLSTGLLATARDEDLEAVIAQRLVAVKNRDVSVLILLNGILNVFTIYPARMLAFLFGTSLRTFTEDTPSDGLERGLMLFLEVTVAGFASIFVRHFARGVERRSDQEAAQLVGRERFTSALAVTERHIAPKTHREVFVFPLKFAVAQSAHTRWLGYHLPLSERLRP